MTQPRSTDVHLPRLQRLRRRLAEEELNGLLVSHGPNVRYLSGFSGSSALLLVGPEGVQLFTDPRYGQQAADEVPSSLEVRVVDDGLAEAAAEELRGLAGGAHALRVGVEGPRLSVRSYRELRERAGEVEWSELEGVVEGLRALKEPGEVGRIEEAAAVACRALEDLLGGLEEGMSELEVVAELEYRLRAEGSGSPPFETIVASGARSALPHASASRRVLEEGDLVLLDFGATVEGYCSDVSRTVVLGPASAWQREVHEAVLRAQRAAREAVSPGRPAAEVDAAARGVLEEAGFGERFSHSTGHGIGLEVHEEPRVSRNSEEVLRTGHVVTIEPGVYLPGRGGVRIEDDIVAEDDGGRALTDFPRRLLEL